MRYIVVVLLGVCVVAVTFATAQQPSSSDTGAWQGQVVYFHMGHPSESGLVLARHLRGGATEVRLRDGNVVLDEKMLAVPAGVEHKPHTDGETHVLPSEPASALNTGNLASDRARWEMETL